MTFSVQENHGQVAGQIINHQTDEMLWHYSDEDLKVELSRCKRKLAQAQRNLFMNWPFGMMLLGVGVLLGGLQSGVASSPQASFMLLGIFLLSFAIPMWWLNTIREREGHAIYIYRQRIALIEFILRDRQDA